MLSNALGTVPFLFMVTSLDDSNSIKSKHFVTLSSAWN